MFSTQTLFRSGCRRLPASRVCFRECRAGRHAARPYMWVTVVALCVVLVGGCGKQEKKAADVPEELSLTTSDGIQLAATFYPVGAASPPGLVLAHMQGTDRRSWDVFARRAQGVGYACIAFDLRGHGESGLIGPTARSYRTFTAEDWRGVYADIDAARQALLDRGVNARNLVLMGASLSASLVLEYAVKHSDIPAVIMISPLLDYKGIKADDALTALGERPVLLMSAEGDSYSATTCTTLKRMAPGFCEQRTYQGAAHGTALFDTSTNAMEQVFLWLAPIVGAQRPATE